MTNDLEFFDACACIGLPAAAPVGVPDPPGASAEELLAAMDRAGIAKALVWHAAQRDGDPLLGNDLLAEALAGRDRLVGVWAILPTQCGELGDLDEWLGRAMAGNVRAFKAFCEQGRYLLRGEVIGDVVERLLAARLPLILPVATEPAWRDAYDLLAEFPELTVILTDLPSWGADRYFRPLLGRYPNVHVEISGYIVDGGLEALVADYGAARALFGSNYPVMPHGGMMLTLAHAEIDDADKQAIAAGNLQRLIAKVRA
ncbi:MAG TPA: amidohydrolase family protein [Phycisphaerae bacterium]|nr:amidohydrolase family protein [Phycisphaerae bacterium]